MTCELKQQGLRMTHGQHSRHISLMYMTYTLAAGTAASTPGILKYRILTGAMLRYNLQPFNPH